MADTLGDENIWNKVREECGVTDVSDKNKFNEMVIKWSKYCDKAGDLVRDGGQIDFKRTKCMYEDGLIQIANMVTNGNQVQSALLLNMGRTTYIDRLYKLRAHGVGHMEELLLKVLGSQRG
jgi:hypothetical protein